jgi:mono/diheme cytochrome c family protein
MAGNPPQEIPAMKKLGKSLLGLLALLTSALIALIAWIQLSWDRDHDAHPAPQLKASKDPAVIAQGEYVVRSLAHCVDCHSPKGKEGHGEGEAPSMTGGRVFDVPVFGHFVSVNLTPDVETGLGAWSDEEIARVLRNGVSRDGHMRPFMATIAPMADEDIIAVISYLRTLRPEAGTTVDDRPTLVGKFVIKGMEPDRRKAPAYVAAGGVSVERGRYLAMGPANCAGCHSEASPASGLLPVEPYLAGPLEPMPDETDPGMEFLPPNLTPDKETGYIYNWDEDGFVARFKAGRVYEGSHMPWEAFGTMTENDMRSIYRFLRSVPPAHRVTGPTRRARGYANPS